MIEEEQDAHAVAEAIVMLSAHDAVRAETAIRWLVRRGDSPVRRASIGRQVSRVLLARITDAWSGGWRPVDVHTFTGRELDAAAQAMAGDAIAAELAAYAVPTLAESWPEQLRTMDARPWWPADCDFVTGRAQRDGFEATLRTALQLAALVSTLPVIERIDPLPGTARPRRPGDDDHREVDPRLLERVRRLLAQAESTPYEAEADTFTAAAQSLMARHSLDAAMVAASADRHTDRATPVRVWVERPYEQEKVRLLQAVAEANRSRTVWSSALGFATIVGHAAELAAVEAIFTSLLLQATRAMMGEGRQVSSSGASRTRSFRRSFLTAYAVRIGERLRAATDAETESALDADAGEAGGDTSRALVRVLAERSAEVDAVVDELFPRLIRSPSRFTPDPHGWRAGQRAADAASLSAAAATLDRPGATSQR